MNGYPFTSTSCEQALRHEGHIVCQQLLTAQIDEIHLCLESIDQFIVDSFDFLLTQSLVTRNSSDLRREFRSSPINRRLAMVLMLGGRKLFDHFSPALNATDEGYSPIKDFPVFDCRCAVSLATDNGLRKILQPLIGKNMVLSSRVKPIIRLSVEDMDYMDQWMLAHGLVEFESHQLLSLYALDSPWFTYQQFSPGSHNLNPINVCIALVDGCKSSGGYCVIPESHLLPDRPHPTREEVGCAKALELQCGDVLVFDNNLFVQNSLSDAKALPFLAMVFQYLSEEDDSRSANMPDLLTHADQPIDIGQWWQSWCLSLSQQMRRG